jgi:hypothetical protein
MRALTFSSVSTGLSRNSLSNSVWGLARVFNRNAANAKAWEGQDARACARHGALIVGCHRADAIRIRLGLITSRVRISGFFLLDGCGEEGTVPSWPADWPRHRLSMTSDLLVIHISRKR